MRNCGDGLDALISVFIIVALMTLIPVQAAVGRQVLFHLAPFSPRNGWNQRLTMSTIFLIFDSVWFTIILIEFKSLAVNRLLSQRSLNDFQFHQFDKPKKLSSSINSKALSLGQYLPFFTHYYWKRRI